MIVNIIVATAENGVIGKEGRIPWNLSSDMRYFKETTMGRTVVMGRKTFESIGKPLAGRKNIVVTQNSDWKRDGVETVFNLQAALDLSVGNEVFIIGGGEIYRTALNENLIDRIYLTRIHAKIDGDTFFHEINPNLWQLVSSEFYPQDGNSVFDYSFEIYAKQKGLEK